MLIFNERHKQKKKHYISGSQSAYIDQHNLTVEALMMVAVASMTMMAQMEQIMKLFLNDFELYFFKCKLTIHPLLLSRTNQVLV